MKNANILYERLKGKGNIAQRALKILKDSGKTTSLGRDYNLRYVYILAKKPGVDPQADLAIIQACEEYLAEIETNKVRVAEKQAAAIERMQAVLG